MDYKYFLPTCTVVGFIALDTELWGVCVTILSPACGSNAFSIRIYLCSSWYWAIWIVYMLYPCGTRARAQGLTVSALVCFNTQGVWRADSCLLVGKPSLDPCPGPNIHVSNLWDCWLPPNIHVSRLKPLFSLSCQNLMFWSVTYPSNPFFPRHSGK